MSRIVDDLEVEIATRTSVIFFTMPIKYHLAFEEATMQTRQAKEEKEEKKKKNGTSAVVTHNTQIDGTSERGIIRKIWFAYLNESFS